MSVSSTAPTCGCSASVSSSRATLHGYRADLAKTTVLPPRGRLPLAEPRSLFPRRHGRHLNAELGHIDPADGDLISAARIRDRGVLAARCLDQPRSLERAQQVHHLLLAPAPQRAALGKLVEL